MKHGRKKLSPTSASNASLCAMWIRRRHSTNDQMICDLVITHLSEQLTANYLFLALHYRQQSHKNESQLKLWRKQKIGSEKTCQLHFFLLSRCEKQNFSFLFCFTHGKCETRNNKKKTLKRVNISKCQNPKRVAGWDDLHVKVFFFEWIVVGGHGTAIINISSSVHFINHCDGRKW